MVTLADALAWVKSLGAPYGVAGWTIARLDASKERRIGLYQRPASGGREVAIGGEARTLSRTKRLQLLVHWTANARDTEEAAQALYDALAHAAPADVGSHRASYVEMLQPEPVDLGPDEGGTFERSIQFDIHYQ